jgi:signal transduction histidine kinase/streptogramin lyase
MAASISAFRCTIFALVLLCLSGGKLSAQLSKYKYTRFTEPEGLPALRVHTLLSDQFGYLWVGTINGLARYDGYNFKRFYANPNDSSSMYGLIIWSLHEDKKGHIWIGAGTEHLNELDPATGAFTHHNFKHLVTRPANVEIGVITIAENRKGRKYLGISSNYGEPIKGGLLYLEKGETAVRSFLLPDGSQPDNVYDLEEDNAGNIWGLSFSGVFKLDTLGRYQSVKELDQWLRAPNEYYDDFEIDSSGRCWLVTNLCNIVAYDPESERGTQYSLPAPLTPGWARNKILTLENQSILFTSPQGLRAFSLQTKNFDVYTAYREGNEKLPALSSIARDAFGNIWVGSQFSGLLKLEEKPGFRSFTPGNPKPYMALQGWVNVINEIAPGKILFTSNGDGISGGLNVLDMASETVQNYTYPSIKKGINYIPTFMPTGNSEVIMCSNLGMYRYNPISGKLVPNPLDPRADTTASNRFITDSRKTLWIGTRSGLLRKRLGESSFQRVNIDRIPGSNASSNEISFFFESRKRGLWMASNNGLLLYRYDVDSIERHGFDKSTGDIFATQDINAIYEDSTGRVWVGTWQGGLSCYTPETRRIKTYTREHGLPSMSIQGILMDEKSGALWLSTFDGLCRFDTASGRVNSYTIDDGIQGLLFSDGSVFRSRTGHFLFGGANGLTMFHPDDFSRPSTPPRVYLTAIKLFNKPLIPDSNGILKEAVYQVKEIELQHDQNNLSFEFIALHYANPGKNRYAYVLENYDAGWREVVNQREAFYPRLPPGKYLFRVKASNSNGTWNEEGIRLFVTVLPPWWQRPWAYALYLLIAIALGLLVNRFMRSRLLSMEIEKQRAFELAHAREIEKAYKQLEESHETLKATQAQLIQSEKMASLGELTAGIAHEIQNPLNFVNNFAELNQELLQEMKAELIKGNPGEAAAIADDVMANQAKIEQHGKRADAIVKNMLQHSRAAAAEKEDTDINALADEYLRLAYHGLRARDKDFNSRLETNYDPTLPLVPIMVQDISRVLLNIFNNAFYAVQQKKKSAGAGFDPMVSVTTRLSREGGHSGSAIDQSLEGVPSGSALGQRPGKSAVSPQAPMVVISIRDNGAGIPSALMEKIFQPFFTTKPAGQGTGLGLSLSYDIVRAHGGEILVETREGEYTEFRVILPSGIAR